ncbi:NAD dependent epimerase/dehydratase family protein [Verticillium dahliae VdLs.17]|uniref:NAD dependent epimerase/dehydratase family protein n=1 Tax=Verticillium dahliae (strain VdLs.17 / ATCC MYA-4575 / FGSC 10137) TaxID=498257 RepID=G2X9Y0_VERDV|nr:NAD dependent epimerase/dehydratase family protein [Verticillium dahliae VdLs.17]EGY16011.1 NAD dependent epimerase/dehydratase family protein [Verticillium dahliae VdLs.17]
MAVETRKILLTGATGFIGGSILTHLLESPEPSLKDAQITCLLRGTDRAEKLSLTYGDRVKPVVYEGLDDLDATTAAAAEHDIVINTTAGHHTRAGVALVEGLAKRKALTGRDVWILHTSGTSNIGDRPITKPDVPVRVFDDLVDDTYSYEKALEAEHAYPQRTAELSVIDTGLALGVKTLVIMSPIIYGEGRGIFNKTSIQTFTHRTAVKRRQVAVVEAGNNIYGHRGPESPNGPEGASSSARTAGHTMIRQAELIAAAGHELGVFPDRQIQHLGLEEAAWAVLPHVKVFTEEQIKLAGSQIVEAILAANARSVPSVARRLGWKPSKGEDAWEQSIKDDVRIEAAALGLL